MQKIFFDPAAHTLFFDYPGYAIIEPMRNLEWQPVLETGDEVAVMRPWPSDSTKVLWERFRLDAPTPTKLPTIISAIEVDFPKPAFYRVVDRQLVVFEGTHCFLSVELPNYQLHLFPV